MPQFTVEQLREDQLAEAAAFLRISNGESVAGWWESEAGELTKRGGGVLVARSGGGGVHGVATYEIVKRGHSGRVLVVATLLSFDLSRKQPAKKALIHALELISAAFECSAVAVRLPANGHLKNLAAQAPTAA